LVIFDEIIENCWKDPNIDEDKNQRKIQFVSTFENFVLLAVTDYRNKYHIIKCIVDLFEVGFENAKITIECLNSFIFEELKCKWSVKHIGINHTFGFAILEVEGKEGHQIYGWVNRLY